MDTVLDHTWTVESFLAWEDRREFKYEFDGRGPVPTTGGSLAHQRIVVNLCFALMTLLEGLLYQVAQEIRLRIDRRVRYSDAAIFAGPLDQTARTLTDAVVLFVSVRPSPPCSAPLRSRQSPS